MCVLVCRSVYVGVCSVVVVCAVVVVAAAAVIMISSSKPKVFGQGN